MRLDLHGLTESEAIGPIISKIISFIESDYEDTLEIITGNGYVLTRLVEEQLEDNNLTWCHENGNTGSYIIKK